MRLQEQAQKLSVSADRLADDLNARADALVASLPEKWNSAKEWAGRNFAGVAMSAVALLTLASVVHDQGRIDGLTAAQANLISVHQGTPHTGSQVGFFYDALGANSELMEESERHIFLASTAGALVEGAGALIGSALYRRSKKADEIDEVVHRH